MYDTILSPINYSGLELKNRIIFAPTTMGLREKEYFEKLSEIARGGCAMIIIGDVPVGKGYLSLRTKSGFAYYKRLCETVHAGGSKICAQLHQSDTCFSGMWKYVPGLMTGKIQKSQLRELMTEGTGDYISSLPESQVKEITESFGSAALLAAQAGFDMVQVHGDRMCGSFSSALFNHRQDCYGGSPENRARFAVESIEAIRKVLPELPIDYKLAVRQEDPHYGNAGVLKEELPVFVPLLEQAGVTSFHVTLADHSRLEDPIPPADHPYFGMEGCFLPYCDLVRKYTDLPICGVGGLTHPDFVEQQLASGRIDCASMSRQLIADPQWVKKLQENQGKQIHLCIRCNKKCLGGMYNHQGVHCIYEGKEHK